MNLLQINVAYPRPVAGLRPTKCADSWFDENFAASGEKTKNICLPVIRARKFRLLPDARQANIMNKWIEIYNKIYNYSIQAFHREKHHISARKLRGLVCGIMPAGLKNKVKQYKMPAHTRDNAIMDVKKAFDAAVAKGGKFRLRPKKKTAGSIYIGKEAIVLDGIAVRSLGKMRIERDGGFAGIDKDCRLKKENKGFYLCVPYTKSGHEFTATEDCGIDPGLRTFQTVYRNGETIDICTNYGDKIKPLMEKIDQAKGPKAKRFRRRIYDRIKHLTDDLHWKSIKWIVQSTNKIYIGKFSTSRIAQQEDFPKTLKRLISAQSHYTFRMRLIQKCEEMGKEVIEVNEAYTSMTCGGCRALHRTLGANKVYVCQQCGYVVDRDANAARNMLIKGKFQM
jgi:IS605 OrfB family transposase